MDREKDMSTEMTADYGRIGVLMGGYSSERDISLKSGKAIFCSLTSQGYNVLSIDIVDRDQDKIINVISKAKIDIAFIALHGQLGEDGIIQEILENLGIVYTGSGIHANRLAFDKSISQILFRKNNINVPAYVMLSIKDQVGIDQKIRKIVTFPVIVKPTCEGSSLGITIVSKKQDLSDALVFAWQFCDHVLVEDLIHGREVTVGILGEEKLPIVEIRTTRDFFDYTAKYEEGMTEYLVPSKLPLTVQKNVQDLAWKAHQILGCSDLSRVDFILDKSFTPYVLEINTIPGFTATSLLPKAAKQAGISFDEVVSHLVHFAYAKKKEKQDITLGC